MDDSIKPAVGSSEGPSLRDGQAKLSQINQAYVLAQLDLEERKKLVLMGKERDREREELRGLKGSIQTAKRESEELRGAIGDLQHEWIEYRENRRLSLRQKMLRTELETFELPSGKSYRDVTITSIDDTGVRISHASGMARIVVADLPVQMRRDLDLDLEAAAEALAEERTRQNARLAQLDKNEAMREKEEAAAERAVKTPNLAVLKEKVEIIRAKRDEALRDEQRARANDQSSSQRSGPDRLETWGERAVRMQKNAMRYDLQVQALTRVIEKAEADQLASESEPDELQE